VVAAGYTDVTGANVRVMNRSTGHVIETEVRAGRFLVQGLDVGGPYAVLVSGFGFVPVMQEGLILVLGQRLDLHFVLEATAIGLDTIRVATSNRQPAFAGTRTGVGTTISDSLLRRLPTINRDLYDFARLTPQISTRLGLSGAGVGLRFNSYMIDGISERGPWSNAPAGGPAAGNGKAISVDAIKEYQVLISPYDARYGDFSGAVVHAVTRGGTNDFSGTMFVYARSEELTRRTPFLRNTPDDRTQFGLTAGGPVVRDRIHFFLSTEFQALQQPARGPYVGQGPESSTPLPVLASDAARFADDLRGYGLDPGSAGRVTNSNPNANVFGRIDVSLPEWSSRLVMRHNFAHTEIENFARPVATNVFPFSSNSGTLSATTRTSAMQLFTQLPRGAFNTFLVGHMTQKALFKHVTPSPLIQVSVRGASGGSTAATLVAGPAESGQGTATLTSTTEIADHLAFPVGHKHLLTMGARAELFTAQPVSVGGSFGRWTFSSLDSLEAGEAATFRLQKDFGATPRLRGTHVSVFLNDEWQATPGLAIVAGIRADILSFRDHAAYNPAVDSVFGRRTSDMPKSRVQWSPRLGFVWALGQEQRARLRGGVGIFSGRPPLGWLGRPLRFDGASIRTLNCAGGGTSGIVPAFEPELRRQPTVCANGTGFTDGPVNLVDRNLRMGEQLRFSLAYDRFLPWDVAASVEAMYSRTLSDFMFANVNLAGPQGVDRNGRVLYGTFDPSGMAVPAAISRRFPASPRNSIGEVIDVRNHSQGFAWSLTGRVEKQLTSGFEAAAAYTHSRVRDVQSLSSTAVVQPFANWATGRTMSGRHEDITTGTSSHDLPHRVVLAATWTLRRNRWATDLSLYYVGESGTPFTFTDSSATGLGDLNADGTNANDPIYVPRNALHPSEIAFDGIAEDRLRQQTAFERFIESAPCLRRQRGRIVERNSCRGPWVNTANASVRQSLPALWGHNASLQLEVFNLLNLIDKDWGQYKVPTAVILQQTSRTAGSASTSQPVFHFDDTRAAYSVDNVESAYRIQIALRYSF
jgi:hypothetical protein